MMKLLSNFLLSERERSKASRRQIEIRVGQSPYHYTNLLLLASSESKKVKESEEHITSQQNCARISESCGYQPKQCVMSEFTEMDAWKLWLGGMKPGPRSPRCKRRGKKIQDLLISCYGRLEPDDIPLKGKASSFFLLSPPLKSRISVCGWEQRRDPRERERGWWW